MKKWMATARIILLAFGLLATTTCDGFAQSGSPLDDLGRDEHLQWDSRTFDKAETLRVTFAPGKVEEVKAVVRNAGFAITKIDASKGELELSWSLNLKPQMIHALKASYDIERVMHIAGISSRPDEPHMIHRHMLVANVQTAGDRVVNMTASDPPAYQMPDDPGFADRPNGGSPKFYRLAFPTKEVADEFQKLAMKAEGRSARFLLYGYDGTTYFPEHETSSDGTRAMFLVTGIDEVKFFNPEQTIKIGLWYRRTSPPDR